MDKFVSLEDRPSDSNKGNFGHALLIGGSYGMAGAISIAALGALRSGAGLTTVATPSVCVDTVASFHPVLMTVPLPCDRRGRISRAATASLRKSLHKHSAVAIGPGMGQSLDLQRLVLELYQSCQVPLILDADALNMLAKKRDWSDLTTAGPRILTPHPGEFQRLSNVEAKDRPGQIQAAQALAASTEAVIVLKGSRTVVIDPTDQFTNSTGNPKIAVGGSGDLLTGIIASLICQKMSPFEAARLAVHLHGLAADLAAEQILSPSVLATDIVDFLPQAFGRLKSNA